MNNLILLCGKTGCGKTTLASRLKNECGVIHLSADNFMLKLFGEISDRELFDQSLTKCKNLIYEITEQLLAKNDVVLDFGFWGKSERDYVKSIFKNHNVILIYLKLDDEKIFNQIINRNQNLKENEYYIDKSTFDFLSKKFEEPTIDENIIEYSSENDFEKIKNIIK